MLIFRCRYFAMNLLEIYSDFLRSQVSQATTVGLEQILDKKIKHHAVTTFLNTHSFEETALWQFASRHLKKWGYTTIVIPIG